MNPRPDAPAFRVPPPSALRDWWQKLGVGGPASRLWYGAFLCHDVEALVELSVDESLDPMQLSLLQAVAADEKLPRPRDDASADFASPRLSPLFVDPQLAYRIFHRLAEQGLVTWQGRRWSPTDKGREAVARGTVAHVRPLRQRFFFVDNAPAAGASHFLSLRQTPPPSPPPAGWKLTPAILAECIERLR